MTVITNAKSFRQYQSIFSLIAKLILAFDSSPNMDRKVKNLSPNIKQIASQLFTLLNILTRIVTLILSINSKQFHQ